jgi:hypothetical protein
MKIFQPIVTGSFTTSGSVFLKGLTSAAQSNVVIIDTATGQLYTTASSAFGGGGGGGAAFPYTGSAVITGSLTVTGSLSVTQGITGSLFGTASYAISGGLTLQQVTANGAYTSNAITVTSTTDIAISAVSTDSDAISGETTNGIGVFGGSVNEAGGVFMTTNGANIAEFRTGLDIKAFINSSGSINAPSFTGSLFGSSSYALTASHALNGGGGAAFPYSGSAVITGSLVVTSTLQLDGSLTDYATVNSTIVGLNNLYTQATGSYTATFVKYTVSKGTNSRAGEFIVNWNGALPVEYTDVSTTDIGSTSDVVFSSAIVSSQIQVNATTATSGWKIKTLTTFI